MIPASKSEREPLTSLARPLIRNERFGANLVGHEVRRGVVGDGFAGCDRLSIGGGAGHRDNLGFAGRTDDSSDNNDIHSTNDDFD